MRLFGLELTTQRSTEVLFSPKGGCTARIAAEIRAARKTIRGQFYSFTNAILLAELLEARDKRGVDVKLILDKSHARPVHSKMVEALVARDVTTLIDMKHAISHNKVWLIDNKVALSGSFNPTVQAEESNAENLLILRQAYIITEFNKNWDAHAAHSTPVALVPKLSTLEQKTYAAIHP